MRERDAPPSAWPRSSPLDPSLWEPDGAPRRGRFIVWSSTAALGNALHVYLHAFAVALFTGRELVTGLGTVPSLLCGPRGAFRCGFADFRADRPFDGTPYADEKRWAGMGDHLSLADDVHTLPAE